MPALPPSRTPEAKVTDGRCLLILGMHRSGTSMLAGTLRRAGLHVGRVLDEPFALNPTGLQEPPALIWMHENLLEANGGSWHDPPEAPVWGKLHCAVRDLFIESRAGHPFWGFKEPRTLLVVEGWIEVLPDWTAVGIFRHPAEVAASLVKRNGFERAKAFALWETYNRRLLGLQRAHGFPMIEFTTNPGPMQDALSRVLDRLGLDPAVADSLFDASIPRHAAADLPELPGTAAGLLSDLRAACL